MHSLRRTFEQFQALYGAMSPAQRGTLIALPLVVLGALTVLICRSGTVSYVPLSWGKTFTREELMLAEQSLLDAGLNDFHSKGQQLLVPSADAERYNAALLEGGTLPSNWGEELEKQFESNGLFSSDRQQQARKDIALAKELRRIIRAVPDVEDANVIWARSQGRNRWPYHNQRVTATVNVLPRRNRSLSLPLANSLRSAVANMVPDLSPEDVTVFDQSTGNSYSADGGFDSFSDRILSRVKHFEQLHQSKIAAHLAAYIPNVVVTVNVELDSLKRHTEHTQTLHSETIELGAEQHVHNDKFPQQPSRSEAGAVSNRPLELLVGGGIQNSGPNAETIRTSRVIPQESTISEAELVAAIPRAVHVSVSIPRDYYRKVAQKRAAESNPEAAGDVHDPPQITDEELRSIEQEVRQDVERTVSRLIPAGSPETAVSVSSYTRVETDTPDVEGPIASELGTVFSRWGGTAGLMLLAVAVLWTVSKSVPKQRVEHEAPANVLEFSAGDDINDDDEMPLFEPDDRSKLQQMVRDNPQAAASVLSRWIEVAK